MTGAVVAIADLPQIEAPTPNSLLISPFI